MDKSIEDIVIDSDTGLMWQKERSNSRMTWDAAINYVNDLSLEGYADWRLPSKKEYEEILKNNRNKDMFPGDINWYWSSTKYVRSAFFAWCVGLGYGNVFKSHKNYFYYVRCIRG